MRYRQVNEQQPLKKRVNTLINNDDVLSTQEQEEIIGYFSDSLRCTLQFTKVVAALHLLIAAVYLGLIATGSPLVFKVLSQKEKRDLESLWQKRVEGGSPSPSPAQQDHTMAKSRGISEDAVEAGIQQLYQQQRAEQNEQLVTFLTYRTAMDTSPSLTPLNTVMMLFSAGLLAVGGVACWRACRAMRVEKETLVSGEARELGAGPLGLSRGSSRNAAERDAMTEATPRGRLAHRRPRTIKEAVIDPVWHSHTAIQLLLVVCSLVPTLFWVRTLSRSHRQLNELYALLGLPTSGLFFGVTDDVLELLLVVWQPLFHAGIFYMIRSLQDTREKLFGLARIKYRYEKL